MAMSTHSYTRMHTDFLRMHTDYFPGGIRVKPTRENLPYLVPTSIPQCQAYGLLPNTSSFQAHIG